MFDIVSMQDSLVMRTVIGDIVPERRVKCDGLDRVITLFAIV